MPQDLCSGRRLRPESPLGAQSRIRPRARMPHICPRRGCRHCKSGCRLCRHLWNASHLTSSWRRRQGSSVPKAALGVLLGVADADRLPHIQSNLAKLVEVCDYLTDPVVRHLEDSSNTSVRRESAFHSWFSIRKRLSRGRLVLLDPARYFAVVARINFC